MCVWPCIVDIKWPTRCSINNLLIFKLAQRVSGNSLPIIRSARLWFTACGIMSPDSCWRQGLCARCAGCCSLELLMMGKELPETCWDNLKLNILLLLHLVGHLIYLARKFVLNLPHRCEIECNNTWLSGCACVGFDYIAIRISYWNTSHHV